MKNKCSENTKKFLKVNLDKKKKEVLEEFSLTLNDLKEALKSKKTALVQNN